VDAEKIEREFPQFFDAREIARIHRDLQCHIFHFDENYRLLLNILLEDRDGNAKGPCKIKSERPSYIL